MDWRSLYAANQAAITGAGVPTGGLTLPVLGARSPSRAAPPSGRAPRGSEPRRPLQTLVHVPSGLNPTTPVPLVCMLHGCTQNPATFSDATLMNQAADRHGFVVVYPGQDHDHNPQGCWNWFAPEHQQRDRGEPAAIAAALHSVIDSSAQYAIDPQRVFVAGLSAGGAMAAIMAACYPDVFAAAAVHSGLAYRSATDVRSAFSVMAHGGGDPTIQGRAAHAAMGPRARRVPTIVIHGTDDRTVSPVNAINVLRQAMTANHLAAPTTCEHSPEDPSTVRRGHSDGGRSYTESRWLDPDGTLTHELLMIDGLGHAWAGGAAGGSYADPRGPSASDAIWRFFAAASSAG
ncbi:MAG: PHB depolymerase family esterase [Solirubrobacteraceae bacterium]